MAALTSAQRKGVAKEVMNQLSIDRFNTGDVTKSDILSLMDDVDTAIESLESSIISGLSAGPLKTWLLANQSKARLVVELMARARKELI